MHPTGYRSQVYENCLVCFPLSPAGDRDVLHARAVQREDALHAFAGDQASHQEGAADSGAGDLEHRAGEDLDAFLVAFADQVVHVHGVPDVERRETVLHVLELELADLVHG